MRWRFVRFIIILVVGVCEAPARLHACELDLVLAIDVSGSVNSKEYKLQMKGFADAFRSQDLIQMIVQTARRGAVNVAVMQWSGQPHQAVIVGWTRLHDEASVLAFADQIVAAGRAFVNYSTAIGEMLHRAASLFADRPRICRRRVIDVSGDGPNNEGQDIARPRQRLIASGVTINALAIIAEEDGLDSYFRDHLIGGSGAFVMTARDFEHFPEAIRRKLLREIGPSITFAPVPGARTSSLDQCPRLSPTC